VGGGVTVLDAGGGARTRSAREEIKRAGDPASCEASTKSDDEPPEGCGALLRLEVVPIGAARQAQPACPPGSQ
jgi:hypothetical protein